MKVYLCGGINGLSDDEAINWREAATHMLNSLGHTTIDPMRRDYRGKEDDSVQEIINGDLADINDADVLLVNAARPSWGTAMEVFYAFEVTDKIVVVVHPEDKPVSPWLRGFSDAIYHSFPEAIEYIDKAGVAA